MILANRILPTAVLGAMLLGLSSPLLAADDEVSTRELLHLVKQQAAEIQSLKKRLANVEAHEHETDVAIAHTAQATERVAASPAQHQAEQTRLQVQSAVADVRENDMAVAQAQLAANAGSGGGSGSTRWGKNGEAGPIFSSDDGFFTFKPDGRLLLDFTGTQGSHYEDRNISGAQLASARLGGEGTVGPLGYHVEADFAGNSVALRQAYLSYATSLFGFKSKVYLGNFLKDLGTEGSSESARVPFMLRSAASQVGEPVNSSFGLGVQMRVYGDNWHYSLSVSGDSPSASTSGSSPDSIAYLTRAHWNPVKGNDGFLHVGAWYYYENISRGVASINNTPAIALDYNQNLDVSASSIANPTQDHASGYELGGVYRSFWVMSEYAKRTIDSSSVDSVSRHGSSLAAGWLLTGEKPGFSSRSGSWKGVKVNNPFTSGGTGAFELAARVDHYDFRGAPRGGTGVSYTLGLNWYLNDWARVMFDYIRWNTDNKVGDYQGPDWGNSIGVRTQIVF
ncbi:MAG TPA: porin [Rhodanobacter sp.]